jgi:hypothetical protein
VEVRNFQARVVKDDRGKKILDRIKDVSDIFDEPMTGAMVLDAKSNTATPLPAAAPEIQPASDPAPGAPTPETAPTGENAPADSTHPWNQNTFTAPTDKAEQHGNAGTMTDGRSETIAPSAQQLELPIQDYAPSPRPSSPVEDSLESPRRRYAQASNPVTSKPATSNPLQPQKSTHPLLSLAVQPAIK